MLPLRRPPALPDAGLLVGRLAVGVIFVAHGWQKVADTGHSGVAAGFDKLGIPLPDAAAVFCSYVELIGGIALILGLLVPVAGVLIALNMAGAFWYAHRGQGLFLDEGGFEYVMVLGAAALLFAATGAGRFSLDALLWGRRENAPDRESVAA
ncbi:putative oxidoreductase [Actinomadura pelletieri DSM 43383]|uniref:Putative oxidoreductase n=1 Tax=Actinomadura pelletieri DSM 43383 TaxID=1120940 RepID=A0A495QN19_9ACTN|nr:DoxX family protein [Actinomadura pelletieri]RKS74341.1 putative oxidoreductase [Actinomadura pelletieri DSM 43383]